MRKNIICFFILFVPFCTISQEKLQINSISIVGNKITKDDIIFRELTFQKGDVVSNEILEDKVK
jgi:outer membrane protein assembly factor BamA